MQGMERQERGSKSAAAAAGGAVRHPARVLGPSPSETIALQWQRERGELDLRNFLLAIYFMRLGTVVDRAFDRMCRARYRISGGDMRVLLALRRSGHPYARRPTDLFRALLVTSGAITKKVDRLARAGYVDRLPDPAHGGGLLVHLTRKGLKVVDEAVRTLADESVLRPATGQISDAELDALSRSALRILSMLERN
jgi:DNA-binding MarR family transcriptional regulator